MRTAFVLAGAAAVVVATATPAAAGPAVDEAVAALRRDPVFVAGGAERRISDGDAADLRERIRGAGTPIYIAILPSSAAAEVGGDPSQLPQALGQGTGLAGTYAVIAGGSFRAGSNVLPSGRAGAIASAAFQERRDQGTAAVLEEFVKDVRTAAANGSTGRRSNGTGSSGRTRSDRGGSGLLGWLCLGTVGAGAVALFVRSRRRKQEEAQEYASDRGQVQAELQVLADDVLRLEPEVSLHPEARQDYQAAVDRYRAASNGFDRATDDRALARVDRVVAEGRYAMSRAEAIVQGRTPPPPPPALQERGPNDEPPVIIERGGLGYGGGWGGPGFYGGGFWGGGDMLTGVLIGSMLGGGLGGGFGGFGGGFGGGYSGGYREGYQDGERDGGSDWGGGGGDWGGGGGDWGGGGGDWGGGGGGGDW